MAPLAGSHVCVPSLFDDVGQMDTDVVPRNGNSVLGVRLRDPSSRAVPGLCFLAGKCL